MYSLGPTELLKGCCHNETVFIEKLLTHIACVKYDISKHKYITNFTILSFVLYLFINTNIFILLGIKNNTTLATSYFSIVNKPVFHDMD